MTAPSSGPRELVGHRSRIRHVIPLVGPSAREALRADQLITLDSIGRAREFAAASVEVEVIGAHFPDETPPDAFDWLIPVPALRRSSNDLDGLAGPRRLPLLMDVLTALDGGEGVDGVVCSNIDIGLRPDFYEAIAGLLGEGWDAFRQVLPSPRTSVPGSAGAIREPTAS
jgi:hypothetical protein